jgi:LysM repeat protein
MLRRLQKMICLLAVALLITSTLTPALAKSVTARVNSSSAKVYKKASRSSDSVKLKKGTTVKVPNPNYKPTAQDTTKTIANNTSTDSATTKCDTIGGPVPAQPKPEIKPVQQQINYTSYTIRQGDTLSSIARRYGTTANDIAQYNHLANKDAIKIGQKLKIPKK